MGFWVARAGAAAPKAPRAAHLADACVLPGRNTTRWGAARWPRFGDLLPPTVYLLSQTISVE